jgi:hypothetical protein
MSKKDRIKELEEALANAAAEIMTLGCKCTGGHQGTTECNGYLIAKPYLDTAHAGRKGRKKDV